MSFSIVHWKVDTQLGPYVKLLKANKQTNKPQIRHHLNCETTAYLRKSFSSDSSHPGT